MGNAMAGYDDPYGAGPEPQVVQVRIIGAGRSYGYEWHGPDPLRIGDWVSLPSNELSPDGCRGRVTAYGRQGYDGPLKAVVAKTDPPADPWTARMEEVKTREEASMVWRKAREAGLSPERLHGLAATGKAALARLEEAKRQAVDQVQEPASYEPPF